MSDKTKPDGEPATQSEALDEKGRGQATQAAMHVFDGDLDPYPTWEAHLSAMVAAAIRAYLSALHSQEAAVPSGAKARVLSELSDRRLLNDVDPLLFDEIAEAVCRAVKP